MSDIGIAMRSLEHAVGTTPQTRGWRSLVANRVEGLRIAYLQEVERGFESHDLAIASTPWISGRLERLRRDQARIADELEMLARACVEALDIDILRAQVSAALQRIARLRQRETDLIYESVDLDLGGEQ